MTEERSSFGSSAFVPYQRDSGAATTDESILAAIGGLPADQRVAVLNWIMAQNALNSETATLARTTISTTSPGMTTTMSPASSSGSPRSNSVTPTPRRRVSTKRKRNGFKTPPASTSDDDDEPQMSTPDDPVIHSPPSLGGQMMGGYNPSSFPKSEEPMNVNSPEGSSMDPNGDGDARRRQKTCRVCGDHATGYNFNVITCESCKAFFRRNALRPKEFKCPYSEDCEINAVSRRFCQKCRLRKCFAVGMKKEWILNEEQLRRRKNSRLNNMAQQQRQKQTHDITRQQVMKSMTSPLSISPMDSQLGALGQRPGGTPLVSPPQSGYSLMSPPCSMSDSPPSRPIALGNPGQRSPDAYESNMMMQQRLRAEMAVRAGPSTATTPVAVDPARNQVVLSMDGYNKLMQMASTKTEEEPPMKRSIFGTSPGFASGAPLIPSPTCPSSLPSGPSTLLDLNGGNATQMNAFGAFEEKMAQMRTYFDRTIEDALKLDSPEACGIPMMPTAADLGVKMEIPIPITGTCDPRINFQLNAAELRELDLVKEAFNGMDEEMEPGRQKASFLKDEKSPADIMNIMDVAMRRLVRMAKKLPGFVELSQDAKFSLLKVAMIEMLCIRGMARFDSHDNAFKSPTVPSTATVSVDSMFDKLNKEVRVEQKQRVMQFFNIFHEDIRKNEMAISLMTLITLFAPRESIQNENDKKVLAKNYHMYSALLSRYLGSLYGEESYRLCEQMPFALKMLRDISQHSGLLFFNTVTNADEAEPLPREILKVE